MNLIRIIKNSAIITITSLSAALIFLSSQNNNPNENFDIINFSKSYEDNFFDYRYKLYLEKKNEHAKEEKKNNPAFKLPKSKDVALIDLTDKSLKEIGTFPIARNNWSKMVDKLRYFGSKVIAFDILFPENSPMMNGVNQDEEFLQAIQNFQKIENNQVILAYSSQDDIPAEEKPIVEGYKNSDDPDELEDYRRYREKIDGSLPPSKIPEETFTSHVSNRSGEGGGQLPYYLIEKHTWPIKELINYETKYAYLNMQEDSGGVFRNYVVSNRVKMSLDGEDMDVHFPSLGVAAYSSFSQKEFLVIEQINDSGSSEFALKIDKNSYQLDAQGITKLRWFGGKEYFDRIELHELLFHTEANEASLREKLAGKIIFVGSSATGAHDLRNTNIDPKLPGVFIHMTVTEMLLNEFFFKPSEESVKISFVIFIISMTILLLVMRLNSATLDLLTLISLITLSFYLDYSYYIIEGYSLKLFIIYFNLIFTYSWITYLNFRAASAEKKQIKGAFSRYVAPAIVDDMLDNPDKLKVGGERKDITCMFSDVRDFTSISEKLTPTELAMVLNRYMGEMTDIVFDTRGTLDKYIGDAIVAFWGAPIDIGDHVDYSVDAAVKMLEALPAINDEFEAKGFPRFEIGLGLNSGECSVGNMGSDQIFAYTALGDNMNLGARLESLCKHYGAQILVSEYTYDRMDKDKYTTRLIDNVTVKGKTKPVGVYEVLYSYHPFFMDPEALKEFKEGYELFVDAKFPEALEIFKKIIITHPNDKASNRLKDVCEHWIQTPPKEGEDHTITTMTQK